MQPMKWLLVVSMVAAFAGEARAQGKYLCCDLNAGATSVACVGQAEACSRSGDFSVQLSDLPNSDAGWAPGSQATIPAGQDGWMYWAVAQPYFGFCLVAPVAGDPTHQDNPGVDPIGCLRVTLEPGVSAEMLDVLVPTDPRWDGYERCFGAADPVLGCQKIANGINMTVSPTPSGSCCGPALPLEPSNGKMNFDVNEDIPGVPPPTLVIQRGQDGGMMIVSYFNQDPPDADIIISSADAGCLAVYGESATCGSRPDGSPAPGPPKADAGVNPVVASAGPRVGCSLGAGTPGMSAAALAFLALARCRRRR
jgi:hypothetical protein